MTDGVLVPHAPLPTVPVITDEQLTLIKNTIAKDATPAELQLFLYDCQRRGVHPLDRLLHFTKRGGRYTPVTSIDFMRQRAASTKECLGIDDALFVGAPMKPDFAALVIVYRLVQGQRAAFAATARWSEYVPEQDFMWRKMPHTMLAKCAEALALRKGFPQELAGLYETAELDKASTDTEPITVESSEPIELPPKLISPAQRKRFFAIASKNKWSEPQLRQMLYERFQYESTTEILADEYDAIVAVVNQPPPKE